jgi:uncharacterized membrane protein YkvA (DUF1232 family)
LNGATIEEPLLRRQTSAASEARSGQSQRRTATIWWQILIGTASGQVLLRHVKLALLWRGQRGLTNKVGMRDALRLIPDVVRLLRRLAADPALPRGVRIRLLLLLAYLLMPIDLVPDFIPVIVYADDAIIVAVALRSVARRAGPEALDAHWPGSPEGLRVVKQLAGLQTPTTPG